MMVVRPSSRSAEFTRLLLLLCAISAGGTIGGMYAFMLWWAVSR